MLSKCFVLQFAGIFNNKFLSHSKVIHGLFHRCVMFVNYIFTDNMYRTISLYTTLTSSVTDRLRHRQALSQTNSVYVTFMSPYLNRQGELNI